MDIVYSCSFSVAAVLILLIVYIYLRLQYSVKSKSIVHFRQLVMATVISGIVDILTTLALTYSNLFPLWFTHVYLTAYLFSTITIAFLFDRYINCFAQGMISLVDKVILVCTGIFFLTIIIINYIHPYIYYKDEEGFVVITKYNSLLYASYIVCFLISLIIGIKRRKSLSRVQLFSIFTFSIIAIGGQLMDIFVSESVVNYFAISLAEVIILLALETPNFKELEDTMQQLEKRTKQLEQAKSEAEKANESKSVFLASMSHEIRTPINGVLGMNSMILNESNDEVILEYAKNIDSASKGLLAIINNILDFSKIESGKMEIAPKNYKFSDIMRDCYNITAVKAKEKQLELRFVNNAHMPDCLYGDENRIRQIVVNILNNALKYTKKGTVSLGIDFEDLGDDKINIIIKVSDTGIGIKKEDMEHLFDAFSRADLSRNRSIEGTGLGLAITAKFVGLMNGTISVDSIYNEGSVFTIIIPQTIVSYNETIGEFEKYIHEDRAPGKEEKSLLKCVNAKILVVDDVEMNLKVVRGLLKDTNVEVDMVESGFDCLTKVRENKYDMILLDHMMPYMDGIETFREMKGMKDVFDISTPVIMLTANAIVGMKEKYLEEGFTDYLSKPVIYNDLADMIRKYLPKEKLKF